jgi:hypothetical protein
MTGRQQAAHHDGDQGAAGQYLYLILGFVAVSNLFKSTLT